MSRHHVSRTQYRPDRLQLCPRELSDGCGGQSLVVLHLQGMCMAEKPACTVSASEVEA